MTSRASKFMKCVARTTIPLSARASLLTFSFIMLKLTPTYALDTGHMTALTYSLNYQVTS